MVDDAVVVVVWQGIYDPGQTQEKDGDRGFILLQPHSVVLPRLDAGRDGVESSKTVRPISPRGTRCVRHVKIM